MTSEIIPWNRGRDVAYSAAKGNLCRRCTVK
jgi:hypothetical protein